jgi:hypothetical protein
VAFFDSGQLAFLGMAASPMARSFPGGPIIWVPVGSTLPHDVMSIPKMATPRVADAIARYLFIFIGVDVVPVIRFPGGKAETNRPESSDIEKIPRGFSAGSAFGRI